MKESLGFYKVEYLNCKVVQTKELISKEEYERYKVLTNMKSELQIKIKGGKKGKNNDPKLIEELKDVLTQLKDFSKPFFVVGSPIHGGIETGIMSLPQSQGGDSPIRLTKVDVCSEISSDDSDSDE